MVKMMPVGGGGPGHVKGPNRQKLDTYLAGAWPDDIQTVITQWTRVHTRLKGAHRTLMTQKKVLESGDGGLSETSPTVVNAVSTFRQSASDLDTKATQVSDAIVQLRRVHDTVQAAIDWTQGKGPDPSDNRYSDSRLPSSHGEPPKKEDFENKLGQLKGEAKTNYETQSQQWHDAQTAIVQNDQIALKHIHALDQVFGDASATVKKVTDAPSSTSPGGTDPGSSVPPPGSSPSPYAPPPGTAPPSPYKPPPGASQPPVYTPPPSDAPPHYHPPHYDPPPNYDPPPYQPTPYDPPPSYDPPPTDDGRLDGGPTFTPTGPGLAPPPPPPTTPGVPMPGGVPGGVPTPSVPGAPPVPVMGPLTAGALGGARPNLTVPEVALGTTARAGGPGVLGRGARTGGMATGTTARGGRGARGAGGGTGRGRGAGARGAGAVGGRGGRKKDGERAEDQDAWDDGSDWLDDEASGPSVLH